MTTTPPRLVPTAALADARDAIAGATSQNGVAVLTGPPKTGRRFAAEFWTERCADRAVSVNCDRVIGLRGLLGALVKELVGPEADRRVNDLLLLAREALEEQHPAVHLHAPERLRLTELATVRTLWSRTPERFPLVLSGDGRLWPMVVRDGLLAAEVTGHVAFESLTRLQVVRWIPGLHPVFAQTSDRVLLLVDESYAHGRIGAWSDVAERVDAVSGSSRMPRLTKDLATRIIADLDEAK